MINDDILEAILKYDAYVEVPLYEENEEALTKIKKAAGKLNSYKRYFEMRKVLSDLGERESDIHIVSHAKSGTTLTQMMLYQMTTDGNMDFKHLYDVSPWPGWALSYDLEIKDLTPRRLIKSHDLYSFMKHIKKGKFIFLIRNVLNSFYHHTKDYYGQDESYEDWVLKGMDHWYKYNEGWLKNEAGLDILYLNYEDTITRKDEQIEKIAKFIGMDISEEKKKRVIERTSFEFMKQHEEKFGEQPNKKKVYNNFIRKGKAGEGIEKSTEKIIQKSQELAEGLYKEHEVTKRYYK